MNQVRSFVALFGIRTWADGRALLHATTPAVLSLLVHAHLANGSHASLVAALLISVTAPAVAARYDTGFRAWFYRMLVPLQAFFIGWGLLTDEKLAPLFGILTAIVGSGIAAANTPTSR